MSSIFLDRFADLFAHDRLAQFLVIEAVLLLATSVRDLQLMPSAALSGPSEPTAVVIVPYVTTAFSSPNPLQDYGEGSSPPPPKDHDGEGSSSRLHSHRLLSGAAPPHRRGGSSPTSSASDRSGQRWEAIMNPHSAGATLVTSIGVIVIVVSAVALRAVNRGSAEARYFVTVGNDDGGDTHTKAGRIVNRMALDAPARKMSAATARQQWLEACAKRLATLGMWASLVTVVCMCAREISTVWVFPVKESDLVKFLLMLLTGTALIAVADPHSLSAGAAMAYAAALKAVEQNTPPVVSGRSIVQWVAVRALACVPEIAERGLSGGANRASSMTVVFTSTGGDANDNITLDVSVATAAAHDRMMELLGGAPQSTLTHAATGGRLGSSTAKPPRSRVVSTYQTVTIDVLDDDLGSPSGGEHDFARGDDGFVLRHAKNKPAKTERLTTLFVDLDLRHCWATVRVDHLTHANNNGIMGGHGGDGSVDDDDGRGTNKTGTEESGCFVARPLQFADVVIAINMDHEDVRQEEFRASVGRAVAQLVFECHRASSRVARLSHTTSTAIVATIAAAVAVAALQAVAAVALVLLLPMGEALSFSVVCAVAAMALAPSPLTPLCVLSLGLVGNPLVALVLTSVHREDRAAFESESIVAGAPSSGLRRAVMAASLTTAVWTVCCVAPLALWIRCHAAAVHDSASTVMPSLLSDTMLCEAGLAVLESCEPVLRWLSIAPIAALLVSPMCTCSFRTRASRRRRRQ